MLGANARYLVNRLMASWLGTAFPYGTLVVNVGGSFILAVVMYLGVRAGLLSPTLRLTLGTGFCGGFTTYSTFNYETVKLLQEGAWLLGAANVLVTLAACALAGLAGWGLVGWLGRVQ